MRVITEQDIEDMRRLIGEGDTEAQHGYADDILCRVLRRLGADDLVDLWEQVDKWYA